MNVYTTREIADMLRVTERTVKNLIARHELASYKVGSLRRISQEQLDAYLESSCSTS